MDTRRRRRYFALMGTCVVLFVLAWAVVRLWSVPAAIAMCLVAMVIPPIAAIVGNRREPEEPWWREEPLHPPRRRPDRDELHPDPQSDAWWEELDRKDHHE